MLAKQIVPNTAPPRKQPPTLYTPLFEHKQKSGRNLIYRSELAAILNGIAARGLTAEESELLAAVAIATGLQAAQ